MKRIFIVTLFLLTSALAGCDAFLDDEPTCDEAIYSFYEENGCAFQVEGEMISAFDALSSCESMLLQSKENYCEKYVYDWMNCLTQITGDNCSGCQYHWEYYDVCVYRKSLEE